MHIGQNTAMVTVFYGFGKFCLLEEEDLKMLCDATAEAHSGWWAFTTVLRRVLFSPVLPVSSSILLVLNILLPAIYF